VGVVARQVGAGKARPGRPGRRCGTGWAGQRSAVRARPLRGYRCGGNGRRWCGGGSANSELAAQRVVAYVQQVSPASVLNSAMSLLPPSAKCRMGFDLHKI